MVSEEVLDLADIQGAIIPGFRKDHSALIAVRMTDPAAGKAWLRERAGEVSRADEVLAHNRLFKTMRARRGSERQTPKAVWVSISFSARGLSLLRNEAEIKKAFDNPFFNGMFQRDLDDAPPSGWVLGGAAETVPDILLVVAADVSRDLAAEVRRLLATIKQTKGRGRRGLQVIGTPQLGATLPDGLKGHEHFGFKDGVSQPGVRGLASNDPLDFIEDRRLSPQDPLYDLYAEPGQVLVWPGQFVIGYQRQNGTELIKPLDPITPRAAWQRNGSYLVYRRLSQKAHLFWRFCTEQANRLTKEIGRPYSPEAFASLLVGRWPSGAPIVRTPTLDDPKLAADGNSANDFLFSQQTPSVTLADGTTAGSAFPVAHPDANGRLCPFSAHIRKVNPRDDPTDTSGLRETKTRLMLRRGIPYGPAKEPARGLEDDGVDRGLLFMSYQASIDRQFEFVTKTWANLDNSPHDSTPATGHDPIVGQNPGGRFVRIPIDEDPLHDVHIPLPAEPWIVMTGGAYFFTPAISALSGALVE